MDALPYIDYEPIIPLGHALPPGKSMKCNAKLVGRTKLRVINEQDLPASIMLNGRGIFVPATYGSVTGNIDLTRRYLEKYLRLPIKVHGF